LVLVEAQASGLPRYGSEFVTIGFKQLTFTQYLPILNLKIWAKAIEDGGFITAKGKRLRNLS